MIYKQEGKISEALTLFQAATCLNPHNISNLKEVGRCLYLLGKHRQALEVFEESLKVSKNDWEIYHSRGLCLLYLARYEEAIQSLEKANNIHRHDSTYIQISKIHIVLQDLDSALDILMEALEFSPDSTELLTSIGLLYLKQGDNQQAISHLVNSLSYDPRNSKTLLAAASIIQDNQDLDIALVKYRVACYHNPNSSQIWNNIGLCLFGKLRNISAIASLKKAIFLGPFEWTIAYNLGLVLLCSEQYTSAFHYFSVSINLKRTFPRSYMFLAVCLANLEDFHNACYAFEHALSLDKNDYLCHLNYAVALARKEELQKASLHVKKFKELFRAERIENEEDDELEDAFDEDELEPEDIEMLDIAKRIKEFIEKNQEQLTKR